MHAKPKVSDLSGCTFALGNTLLEKAAAEAAIIVCRQCLLIAPHHAEVLYNLANALPLIGRIFKKPRSSATAFA